MRPLLTDPEIAFVMELHTECLALPNSHGRFWVYAAEAMGLTPDQLQGAVSRAKKRGMRVENPRVGGILE